MHKLVALAIWGKFAFHSEITNSLIQNVFDMLIRNFHQR